MSSLKNIFSLLFLSLFPQIQFHLHESVYFPCDERKTIINLNAADPGSPRLFGFEARAVKEYFKESAPLMEEAGHAHFSVTV